MGIFFSRSSLIFFEIRVARIIMAVDNRMARRDGIRTRLVMKLRTTGDISILPYTTQRRREELIYVISGCHREVAENCTLLGLLVSEYR